MESDEHGAQGSADASQDEGFLRAATAVRADPSDDGAWDDLEDFAASTQRPDDVSVVYREVLSGDLAVEVAPGLAQRAVQFHEEWYREDSPVLVEVLRRVLEVDPTASDWAFQRLTVVYTVAERGEEPRGRYDRESDAALDETRRATLLEEAAQTAKDFAGKPELSIKYLQRLLPLRRGDRNLASSLERLLERYERWEDLVALWRELLPSQKPEQARETRLRIAGMFQKLGRPGDALAELKDLLSDADADNDEPLAMLEGIAKDESLDVEARRDALTFLRETYAKQDRQTDVIGTLDTALELAGKDERVGLHRDAAERLLAQDKQVEAMEHLGSILRLTPTDDEALQQLRSVAQEAGEMRRFVDVLVIAADAAQDGGAPLRLEAAQRLVELDEIPAAIPQLQLLAGEPGVDRAIAVDAGRQLAELLGRRGREADQLVAYERLAQLGKSDTERRDALGKAARLAGDMALEADEEEQREGYFDRALALWERCLELEPHDDEALLEMIAILERAGRHRVLVETLRRRADGPVSDWQKRADLVRIARIQSEKLELAADAIATWNEVASGYGEDSEVADALAALYEQTERWEDLAAVLERTALREDQHLASVRARQGKVYAERLERAREAVGAYRRALEADPKNEDARAGLAALCEIDAVRREAVEALARSYRETDEWEPLLALLELRLTAAPTAERRTEILEEAAAIQEKRSEAPGAALVSIRRALVTAPHDASFEAELLRLAAAAGDWATAADGLGEAAAATDDASREAHLRDVEADLREKKLEDLGGAFEASIAALLRAPTRPAFAERVARLALATEGLADAEEALAAAADHPHAPPTHLDQLASVQQPGAGLRATLLRIADARPADLDALSRAASIAADSLEDVAAATADHERLYARASGLARRRSEASGEVAPADAVRVAVERLVGYYEESSPEKAVGLLADAAGLPFDTEVTIAWRRDAAGRAAEAGDKRRAARLYRAVLEDDDADVEALRALAALYAAEGRHGELLALRHRELEVATEPDRRLELRMDVARLVTAVEESGGRMEALRANLQERPGHPPSIDALSKLLSARRGYEELASLLAEQATMVEPRQSALLWARVAQLSETELDDVDRALEAHRKVVEHDPASIPALDALARMHEDREEWAAASRWLERRLAVADEENRADLSVKLARALIAAGRNERACEVLELARAEEPARDDIRDLLMHEYREREAWEPLARVLTDAAEKASDSKLVLGFVREAAALYGEKLGKPAEAIPVLRRGIELAPDDRRIRLQLATGLRDAEELDEARQILEQVVADFGRRRSTERAQVHYELGAVARAQGDLEGALEQLELATKMAMAEPRMLQMLGRLAREAGQLDRAEKAYRALLMTVRRRGATENLDVGSAEVLYELHAIAKARGEEDSAHGLRDSAIEAAAQNDAEALRFRDALVEREERELALEGLERRQAVAEEPESKAVMLAAAADLLDALERPEDAYQRRLKALEHAPGDAAIHDAALTSGSALGRVADYVKIVETLVDTRRREEDATLQASLFVRLGAVAEESGQADEAIGHYTRAETLVDSPVEAWEALARIGGARGDVPLQKRVLGKLVEIEGLAAETEADALHQLAGVLLRDAATPTEESVAIARRAFDADPRHESLVEALDTAAARGADRATTEEGAPDEVMRLYEEVARDSTDDTLVLRFLERRASRPDATLVQVKEAADRARVVRDAALAPKDAPESEELELDEGEERTVTGTVQTELPEVLDERLARLLERCVTIAREGEEGVAAARWALEELAAIRAKQGRTKEALDHMREAVETAVDEDERRALELRLAEVTAGEGGDLEVAAETYRRLLEEDVSDPVVWRPLLVVYVRAEDEEGLSDLVVTLIDALLEPSLRNEARLAKARFLMAREGREFDAVDLLKQALDEEPDHEEGAELLAKLYEKSGYDEDLVELLERQLDVARDNQDLEKISELSLKLGELLGKVRRDDAMDVYRRALDWVAKDRRIIESYLALFQPEDDPRERAEIRTRLLAIETGDAASQLARTLCEEWQALEEPEGVTRALALGYQGNPEDEAIREMLEDTYRETEQWEPLAEFLASEAVRLAGDPDASVAKLREAAQIRREHLGDAAGAVEMLRGARERSESFEILAELVAALRDSGDLDAAATEVGAALEAHEQEDQTLVRLLRLRAELLLAQGDAAGALQDLEAAYPVAPSEIAEPLVAALHARIQQTHGAGDHDGQRTATLRLVEVYAHAGDAEQARATLASWCEEVPDDVDALKRLRDVDVQAQHWPGVAVSAAKLVTLLEGAEQAEAVMLLADACEAAGAPEEARGGLEHVASSQPENAQVLERLRLLYEAIGAHRELASLLMSDAANAEPERAFELYRRAGRLFIDEVGDADAALPALARAAELKPDDHRTVVLLADSYIGGGYFAEAGQLLEQAISNHPRRRSPELSQLQHRMANLARAAGDRQLQMQWLNAALESDKNNGHVASELALLARELGDLDVALSALRAVTLSRTDGPMSRAQAFLMQAQIAHERGEARRALLWARKAKQEDPELTEAGEFLAQLGES